MKVIHVFQGMCFLYEKTCISSETEPTLKIMVSLKGEGLSFLFLSPEQCRQCFLITVLTGFNCPLKGAFMCISSFQVQAKDSILTFPFLFCTCLFCYFFTFLRFFWCYGKNCPIYFIGSSIFSRFYNSDNAFFNSLYLF